MYETDEDFHDVWEKCATNQVVEDFHMYYGFLMQGNQLCILKSSLQENLICDLCGSGLASHLGCGKTIAAVEERFYWPHLKCDVGRFVWRCYTYQIDKGQSQSTG